MQKRFGFLAIVVMLMGLLLSSCAVNRGVIDVRIPPSQNSEGGKLVKILKVTDLRKFEIKPREPSIPSLKDNQIHNKSITSRAIARKRSGMGVALGDILLPEGRTVEDLAREAVQKALQEKGYSVLGNTASAGGANAIPLSVEIQQFWTWLKPGAWNTYMEFEAIVKIKSPIVSSGREEIVRGYTKNKVGGASGRAWSNSIQLGLEAFIARLKEKI